MLRWLIAVSMLAGAESAVAAPKATLLKAFDSATGYDSAQWPNPPILGQDGQLYGTLQYGSEYTGSLYTLTTAGKNFTILNGFTSGAAGYDPRGQLLQKGGLIYGTAISGGTSNLGTVFVFDPKTQALTAVHSFDYADGAAPFSGLVSDSAGNLYGTTTGGGRHGLGTVFRIDAGTLAFNVLGDFDDRSGNFSFGNLVFGGDGNLYGTAIASSNGYGTIFRVSPNGGRIVSVHEFSGTDGDYPSGGLTVGTDGEIYGTTEMGGTNNHGVVFSFKPGHHSFRIIYNMDEAIYPQGALVFDNKGLLLGTTTNGGDSDWGTVFRCRPKAGGCSVIYSFPPSAIRLPGAGLAPGGGRVFYGTSGNDSFGSIYKFRE